MTQTITVSVTGHNDTDNHRDLSQDTTTQTWCRLWSCPGITVSVTGHNDTITVSVTGHKDTDRGRLRLQTKLRAEVSQCLAYNITTQTGQVKA